MTGVGQEGDPMFAVRADGQQHAVGFNWQNAGGYGNANEGLGITLEGVGPLQRCQTPAVAVAVDTYNQTEHSTAQPVRSAASDVDHTGGGHKPNGAHGRPQTHPTRVRAVAGISRRSHTHRVARQVAAGLPGWAPLQGAGEQHGRPLHGVDRQAHCRAARGPSALPLRMQRDRSGLSRMGTAGLGASGLCRGGEVSQRSLGASLAASAELGGYDEI